ncbi:MAG: hypothetical protein ACRDU8_07690, partial [Egibacteraceae bacterium]
MASSAMIADRSMQRHALLVARAMARTELGPLQASDLAQLEAVCAVQARPTGSVVLRAGAEVQWMTSVAKRLEYSQRRLLSLLIHDLAEQVAALLLDEREVEADP